jgi:hypothetical protein
MNRASSIMSSAVSVAIAGAALAQQCGWTVQSPAESPGSGTQPVMSFDSVRGYALLFNFLGGHETETWTWAGGDWLFVGQNEGDVGYPPQGMVYDTNRQVCVMTSGDGYTFEWDGNAWTTFGSEFTTRDRAAMAYDTARAVAVLYGGIEPDEPEALDETWERVGTDWVEREVDGPGKLASHAMAYDAHRQVTVMQWTDTVNCVTAEWNGVTWTTRLLPGPLVGDAAMVYDSDRQVCVLFGGRGHAGARDETWEYDGESWTEVDTPVAPPRRRNHAMAYDSARKVIVLFGGLDNDDEPLNDTWEFSCVPLCYPDLDKNGTLDLFDFLAYVNLFNAQDGAADCEQNGVFNLFDFFCFVNLFNEGC